MSMKIMVFHEKTWFLLPNDLFVPKSAQPPVGAEKFSTQTRRVEARKWKSVLPICGKIP